jgi:hypothetical protein
MSRRHPPEYAPTPIEREGAMFRLLWSAAKTYLTVKAIEAVAKAFKGAQLKRYATAAARDNGRRPAAP